jgi:hypothetical protein
LPNVLAAGAAKLEAVNQILGTDTVKDLRDSTPQGKIEIYFTPAVNYPSISAIEVIPE